jgi:hypothetical protein
VKGVRAALLFVVVAFALVGCAAAPRGLGDGERRVGSVWVWGGSFVLEPGARLDGDLWLVGGHADVDGLVIGDVVAPFGSLRLGPMAVVRGRVWAAGAFERAPEAWVVAAVAEPPVTAFRRSARGWLAQVLVVAGLAAALPGGWLARFGFAWRRPLPIAVAVAVAVASLLAPTLPWPLLVGHAAWAALLAMAAVVAAAVAGALVGGRVAARWGVLLRLVAGGLLAVALLGLERLSGIGAPAAFALAAWGVAAIAVARFTCAGRISAR